MIDGGLGRTIRQMNGSYRARRLGRLARKRRLAFVTVVLGAAGAVAAAMALAGTWSNVRSARAEARRLLAVAQLPAGARRSAGEPEGAGVELTYSPSVPVVPHLVDLHEFFLVRGRTEGVIGWVQAHRPAGSGQGDSGASHGEGWTSFEFGPVAGVLALRELVVNAVQIDTDRVAVRVDSQVAPLPRLPGTGRGPGAVGVVESGTMLGSFGFELRCDPPGGTVPHPSRICAAIRKDPALLYSFPGPDHSCPPGAPAVSIIGSWDHKPLRSSFSECTGGQEQEAGEWASMLPSLSAEGTVHVDRGIGLVILGEKEAEVVGLLRGASPAPKPCQTCTRTFGAGFDIGYGTGPRRQPLGWTVTFSRARVRQIESNGPDLTVDGAVASRGFTSLRRALHGWSASRCGSTRELVHRSSAGATLIVYGADFERVIVTSGPPSCVST